MSTLTATLSLERKCVNCMRRCKGSGRDGRYLCWACWSELKTAVAVRSHMRVGWVGPVATPLASTRIPGIGAAQAEGAPKRSVEPVSRHRGKPEVVGRPRGQRAGNGPGAARVLVVEDQEGLRDTTAAILSGEGYVVLRAADGVEALERLRGHEIDVMILDLRLPRMDGPALLEELVEPPAVVVCSAFQDCDEVAIRERFGSTVVEFLRKPVSPIHLIAATAAAAAHARAS